MKKVALLLVFLASCCCSLRAQESYPAQVYLFTAAPSGACQQQLNAIGIYNGTIYLCVVGSWQATSSGSMTWPTGSAGIPNYGGSSSWGTTYNALNTIPAAFISTLNQNTTGTAGGLTGCSTSTAGSICYWNGSAWTLLVGNTTQTNWLQETSSGVPSWTAPPGSGTVNSGTQFALGEYATAGTAISSGPTPPSTNGIYSLIYNVNAGAAVAPSVAQMVASGRSITGAATTDVVAATDFGTIVTHDQAATGAVTITLPAATTLNNPAFWYKYCNHSPQTDTLSPTTWTIQTGSAAAGSSQSIASGVCLTVTPDKNNATQWHGDLTNAGGGSGFTTAGAGLYSPSTSTVRRASVADVHLNSAPWFIGDDLTRDPTNFLNGQVPGPIAYGNKGINGTCGTAGTSLINAPAVTGYFNGWDIVTGATSGNDCLYRALEGTVDLLPAPSATSYQVDFAESNDTLANDYHAVGIANIAANGGASSFAGTAYDKIWCDVTDTATAGNWACHFSVGATQTNVTLSPAQTAVAGPTVIGIVVTNAEVDFYFGGTKVGCANSGGTGGCTAWTASSLTTARLSPAWEAMTNTTAAAKTGLYGWSARP